MTYDPNALQFYIIANWNARKDDMSAVGQDFEHFLDALKAIDPTLAEWHVGEHLEDFRSARYDIAAFVKRNVNHDEDGNPDYKDGYSLTGVSRDERQFFSFIGVAGRVYDWPLANEFYFKTDSDGPVDTTIVTSEVMTKIVFATIAVWKPDFCAAFSSDLDSNASEDMYRQAWMTYIPPAHADSVDLVGVPFSEQTANGGLLLSATNKTFDACDPIHLAGAQRIHEAVRHLNATIPSYLEDHDA